MPAKTAAQREAANKRARERRARDKKAKADAEAEALAQAPAEDASDAEAEAEEGEIDEEVTVNVNREVTCGACDQSPHDPACILVDMPLSVTLRDMYIVNVIEGESRYANELNCPLLFRHKLLPWFKKPRSLVLEGNRTTWQYLGEAAELTMLEPARRATSSAIDDNSSAFTLPEKVSEIQSNSSRSDFHYASTQPVGGASLNATPPPTQASARESDSATGEATPTPTPTMQSDVRLNVTPVVGQATVSDFRELFIASATHVGAQIASSLQQRQDPDLLYKNLVRFDGQKASFPAWRRQVECAFTASGNTDTAFIEKLTFKIGPTVSQYMSSQLGNVQSVKDFLDRLARNYDEFSDPQFAFDEFTKYRQAPGTTLTEHHDRLMHILRGMHETLATTDRMRIAGYITSLNSRTLRNKLTASLMKAEDQGKSLKLQDLVNSAKRHDDIDMRNIEGIAPIAAPAIPAETPPVQAEVNAAPATTTPAKRPRGNDRPKRSGKRHDNSLSCKIHEARGHATEACDEYTTDTCKYCKKRVGKGEAKANHAEQCGVGRCTSCGRRGHRSASCRENDRKYSLALHKIAGELERLRLKFQTNPTPAAAPVPVPAMPAAPMQPPPTPLYYPYPPPPPPYNPYQYSSPAPTASYAPPNLPTTSQALPVSPRTTQPAPAPAQLTRTSQTGEPTHQQ